MASLTERPAWQALTTHYESIKNRHLRDLFAADPLQFKKLIYEMRFDEVSAIYAVFGSFFIGLRVPIEKLGELLEGNLPAAASLTGA